MIENDLGQNFIRGKSLVLVMDYPKRGGLTVRFLKNGLRTIF